LTRDPSHLGQRPTEPTKARAVRHRVTERWIGDVRWLVVRGDRESAFRALGEHARSHIVNIVADLPDLADMRRRVDKPEAASQLSEVSEASRRQHPAAWRELQALAEGAQVDFRDLLLLTLRGDLATGDAVGCSDLGWTDGTRALLGHNEDGDQALSGACSLLTLLVDGDPAITTWWYPGFLPGNTFTFNEHHLVWGIDALGVLRPSADAGRGFVARSVCSARTLDDATAYLHTHPAAGGFTYVMGQVGCARLVTVEHAAGRSAAVETLSGGYAWHTNHLRHLNEPLDEPSPDSIRRGGILSQVVPPASATPAWLSDVLAGAPEPVGLRATGDTVTLCTIVADLDAALITLLPEQGRPVTVPIAGLLRGELDHGDLSPAAL
jgi:hypothetical protein